ncbi:chemotaxis protein CheX [Rhodoferax sp.]|uniref:chemotaxis protein CheX n=1 Tax=Rhodoferax sp. TaxID=50421 RepID=UPI0039B8E479
MEDHAKLVSKVLVLDHDPECHERIKAFCDQNNLVGLKVLDENVLTVLKSNVDLGAILLAESYSDKGTGGLALARLIHQLRPELPIFLRRESTAGMDELSDTDRNSFSACYTIDTIETLRKPIEECIFCLIYPNALVRGITELTKTALESQFKALRVEVATPYVVRDRIIFGEIFTLIPIESNWCRGYLMLQTEEEALLALIADDKTHINPQEGGGFRDVNNVLGEITNLVWGSFKNRFVSHTASLGTHVSQVPLIINHLHRYISFGSEKPQLCFKYTLHDANGPGLRPLTIYQRFIFNLNWTPEEFAENEASVEDLFEMGELELF